MKQDINKRRRTYEVYSKWLDNALNDALESGVTGTKIDKRLGLFSQMFLLMQLRNEKYASARVLKSEIDCMADKVFCGGLDISAMEEIWPPSYNDEDGKEWPDELPPLGLDGIDYMQNMGPGINHPIFRIRKE